MFPQKIYLQIPVAYGHSLLTPETKYNLALKIMQFYISITDEVLYRLVKRL